MINFRIRKWEERDIPELSILFDEYRQFYRQPSNREDCARFLMDRFRNEESTVLVCEAVVGGNLLGFTQLYPLFSSVNLGRTWLLNDLFVGREGRRTGAGRALIKAAEAFGRESKAIGLELETEKTNFQAKALYEKAGWVLDTDHDRYAVTL